MELDLFHLPISLFPLDEYDQLMGKRPKFMDFLTGKSGIERQRRLELDHFLWSSTSYVSNRLLPFLNNAHLVYEQSIVLLRVSNRTIDFLYLEVSHKNAKLDLEWASP